MNDSRALTTIDSEKIGGISISSDKGALAFERVGEMMDFAKLMAVSDIAVRKHLRNNAGACLAIVVQANEWGLSPFAVANKSFMVNDQMAYESQLLHAVVEKRAPLKERLRFRFEGEGGDLKVFVTGHLRNETEPLVYESPKVKDIRVKNSPLWASDPQQQLSYYGARAWARRYVPDVLLGLYSEDELDNASHLGADNAKNITPRPEDALHHRLSAKAVAGAGFDPKGIDDTIRAASGAKPAQPQETASVSAKLTGAQAAPDRETSPPVVSPEGAADLSKDGPVEKLPQQVPAADAVKRSASAADPSPPEAQSPPEGSEAATGSDHPDSVAADPDAEAFKPPSPPTDGADYVRYVRDWLWAPQFQKPDDVSKWFASSAEKKLRNGLPNLTSELFDEAKAVVQTYVNSMKERAKLNEA